MIINLTRKKCISRLPIIATDFIIRTRGMIGRDFHDFDAMVFNHCNCIHTMFMRIKLDVIFIDRENKVCETYENLPPWRPLVRSRHACAVIELPAGCIAQTGTHAGDQLDLNAEISSEIEQQLKTRKDIINSMGTAISYKSE